MTAFLALLPVLLKIIAHFLENKTPESKANYVKNLEQMSSALAHDNVESVNDLFDELRKAEGFGDGSIINEKSGRFVQGDGGVVE